MRKWVAEQTTAAGAVGVFHCLPRLQVYIAGLGLCAQGLQCAHGPHKLVCAAAGVFHDMISLLLFWNMGACCCAKHTHHLL